MVAVGQKPTDVSSVAWMDGEWWYTGQADGRRRVDSHRRKNQTRMFVNGRYIPKDHPLHRPGRYKSWEDAWSHEDLETKTSEGYVYIISNPAFEGWIKIGKAVDAFDRVRSYQTGSPFRDYELVYARLFKNRHAAEKAIHNILRTVGFATSCEWFAIDPEVAKEVIENLPECN